MLDRRRQERAVRLRVSFVLAGFKKNKKAWEFFLRLPPYYRKGETRWITSAQQEETRMRRLAKVMAACESGRRR